MNNTLPRTALLALATLAASTVAAPALANDYPTVDRVLFVEACMVQHPGPRYEMLSKCSCVLDKLASQIPFSEFETMVTSTNAFSIGGERGNYIRDAATLTDGIKRLRELQVAAKQGCFIKIDPK